MKFISYGIAIAICSFCRRKKLKQLMFVCTLCCLGTESNVYKTRELKDKAELKDRKARCYQTRVIETVFSEEYKKEMKEEGRWG